MNPAGKNPKKARGNKGFSLIEMLVVVLIMAVLTSIALPRYFKSLEMAKVGKFTDWLASYRRAQDRYYMAHGTFGLAGDLDVEFNLPQTWDNGWTISEQTNPVQMILFMGRSCADCSQITVSYELGRRILECQTSGGGCAELLPCNSTNGYNCYWPNAP